MINLFSSRFLSLPELARFFSLYFFPHGQLHIMLQQHKQHVDVLDSHMQQTLPQPT